MQTVKIKDKTFALAYPEAELQKNIRAVANRLNEDFSGRNPLLLGVLNGCFMFAADLMRYMDITCEISFVKLASYQGTTSTGKVKEVIGLNEDISGRDVIIVEDIVESGHTMQRMIETLGTRNPKSVHICTLMQKPDKLEIPLNIEYVAMKIPNEFIIGYGFDYDQQGRNMRDIYSLVEE
jgi:hypoxanthine phosphoribosyltransferase